MRKTIVNNDRFVKQKKRGTHNVRKTMVCKNDFSIWDNVDVPNVYKKRCFNWKTLIFPMYIKKMFQLDNIDKNDFSIWDNIDIPNVYQKDVSIGQH